jgi:hypothetical protein
VVIFGSGWGRNFLQVSYKEWVEKGILETDKVKYQQVKRKFNVPIPSSKREEIQQTWEFPCRKRIHPQSCGYRRTPCNSGPKGKIWRFGNRYSYRKQP